MTYADECLERAEKASYGGMDNLKFVQRAHIDIPELAWRLKKAIEALRKLSFLYEDGRPLLLIDELEAPPSSSDT